MSNKTYDTLKWIALIALPAAAALYLALAQIWGLPEPEKVAMTVTAVNTFLGAVLGISSKNYSPPPDGVLHVTDGPDGREVTATLRDLPENLPGSANFDVVQH